jgi:hypothetical protein
MEYHSSHDVQSRSYSALVQFAFLGKPGLINSHNANHFSALKPCAINYSRALFFTKPNDWLLGKGKLKVAHFFEVNRHISAIREIHFSEYSSLHKLQKSEISPSQKKLSSYSLAGVENGC